MISGEGEGTRCAMGGVACYSLRMLSTGDIDDLELTLCAGVF